MIWPLVKVKISLQREKIVEVSNFIPFPITNYQFPGPFLDPRLVIEHPAGFPRHLRATRHGLPV